MHFDNTKEMLLACDASPYGVGVVLKHPSENGDQLIAFAFRSLSKAEKNYSHIEKEALALVFGVTHFQNYLLGCRFTLLTDHCPLINLLAIQPASWSKPIPSVAVPRIQCGALILSVYAYNIQFRKSILNNNIDACSRLPLPTMHADPSLPAESVLLLEQVNDSRVTIHHIAQEIDNSVLLCVK